MFSEVRESVHWERMGWSDAGILPECRFMPKVILWIFLNYFFAIKMMYTWLLTNTYNIWIKTIGEIRR